MADMDDDVVAHPGLGHQRDRDGLEDAAQVDDGLVVDQPFDQLRGKG